jgi:hypothetical protein
MRSRKLASLVAALDEERRDAEPSPARRPAQQRSTTQETSSRVSFWPPRQTKAGGRWLNSNESSGFREPQRRLVDCDGCHTTVVLRRRLGPTARRRRRRCLDRALRRSEREAQSPLRLLSLGVGLLSLASAPVRPWVSEAARRARLSLRRSAIPGIGSTSPTPSA